MASHRRLHRRSSASGCTKSGLDETGDAGEEPVQRFSSTAECASCASGPGAALMLRELQRRLALACYHGEVHESLGRTPAAVWAEKVAAILQALAEWSAPIPASCG